MGRIGFGFGAAVLAAALFNTGPMVGPVSASTRASSQSICLYEPRGAQTEVRRFPLGSEPDFALSFIHSVSKTPVRDEYHLVDGQIVQTSEVFEAHGAGLPSIANDIDATGWRHENGQFILDLTRPTGPITIRIQKQFRNTLYVDNQAFELADLGYHALTLAPCAQE